MTHLPNLIEQLSAMHKAATATPPDPVAMTQLAWIERVLSQTSGEESQPVVLARQLFTALERPDSLKSKGKVWRDGFAKLLKEYPFADLSGCLHWIFEVDDFWVDKVMAAADPMAYFESRLESIIRSFRGWRKAGRNRENKRELSPKERQELKRKTRPRSIYNKPFVIPDIEDEEDKPVRQSRYGTPDPLPGTDEYERPHSVHYHPTPLPSVEDDEALASVTVARP